ncbi:lysylphosphatidylglycerol synthetase [Croceivirga radicis]|uniref:Lysylphosphatidylglycerol synthetase n=1 Tax=Croceivirga radicis TaxID=1929488 RepID=A0A1V6LQZ2_9FLAO|nr:lysylphosphatidylglycerol synthase transmembrane domain-containing protein [Croceivirga radicis]OQD42376.1 lysylphosphatidylglycerol synthetase [Croceivirga radicis]
MTKKYRKIATTALKIVVSIALLYFIFTKIDYNTVITTIKKAHLGYLSLALGLFILSKYFNALRLNLYLHAIEVPLSHRSNFKLYLLGMFYNLFLPGGIGGDAYKGYVLKKRFKVSTKRLVAVLLLDRLSGMLLILIYALLLAFFIDNKLFSTFKYLFLLAIPIGVVLFYLVAKQFFSYTLAAFWASFGYSALLQAIQLLCVFLLLLALGITSSVTEYLFVFMVSSIVSVIPLTIGGVGSREVTFLYGAKWLNLEPNISIGISFLFFLISALVSLSGIYYHFKKPKLERTSTLV